MRTRRHPALIKAIQDGYDYVLFWTYDPVDPALTSVQCSITEAFAHPIGWRGKPSRLGEAGVREPGPAAGEHGRRGPPAVP
jgi:hypothetical protein